MLKGLLDSITPSRNTPSPPAPLPQGGEGSNNEEELSPLAPDKGRGGGGEGLALATYSKLQSPPRVMSPVLSIDAATSAPVSLATVSMNAWPSGPAATSQP